MRYGLCGLAMLWGVCAANAAETPSVPGTWIVTIGGEARASTQYMGSDDFVLSGAPVIGVRRPGSPEGFHSPRDGTGFALYDNGVFAAGPVGSLIWPRHQGFNSILNVGFTYQAGGFVDYWAVPWLRTRVEALQGFGASDGITATFAMDAIIPLSPALTWSAGPRTRVVTAAAEGPYFSITPVQSTATGLPVFNAAGGWQSVGAGTQLKYHFNPAWASYGFVEYDKLVGATASSPIVTDAGGSTNQWTVGIGLTYSFTIKGLPF
jgi:MipA family protein